MPALIPLACRAMSISSQTAITATGWAMVRRRSRRKVRRQAILADDPRRGKRVGHCRRDGQWYRKTGRALGVVAGAVPRALRDCHADHLMHKPQLRDRWRRQDEGVRVLQP